MRRLLQIRNMRVFVAGWTASVFGDWAMFIVLGVWTKDLTGSNSAAGLVFFALALPSLLSPFAGLVVDQLPRRPVLMWTYAAEAVGVLSLLFVHDRGDVWIIYAVTLFYGASGTLAASARSALLTVMAGAFLLSRRAIVPQESAEEPALA
jgi:MFS family permease